MTAGLAVFYAFLLYVAAGLATGAAFVAAGVTRVLPHPASFTLGARLLLLPAAAALWPYVLMRWIKARRAR
jgi:hypothetical protein